jgi:hypothetical protein
MATMLQSRPARYFSALLFLSVSISVPGTGSAQSSGSAPQPSNPNPPAQAADVPAAPASTGARILLLPRQLVSGERATLAVLDVNGRLTPNVAVSFSNGDHLKTDATGRALFVAPLTTGVIFGSIDGRAGRVTSSVHSATQTTGAEIEVLSAPRIASISDRFDVMGHGFCGDADANSVAIDGQKALVLASSPMSLVILPPPDANPGEANIKISCAKHDALLFPMTFVELALEADTSPLAHGAHRALRVRVTGSAAKLVLEARNLAPDIAELVGGNPAKQASSGGPDNVADFEVIGRKKGSFLISIRLLSPNVRPVK